MKKSIERRKPKGIVDHLSIALTTFGVGYFPIAPGTWGSAVAVLIYVGIGDLVSSVRNNELGFFVGLSQATVWAVIAVTLFLFILLGIWASNRTIDILGSTDPSQAVVDEVMGQLIVFAFVPFGVGWPLILVGFLLFRFFDIWKPYPINDLQILPGGLGICADDIVAGVYAGICLSIIYATGFLS
ncbi:phosphatidylglycerophosphatase A [Leptolyngbya sp. 7M]|uniref:phosphatidylglycerophosphatase A family protein n=1 Tax=Leptolyngbya sp. 7M TaxID=2812896 RepID=UPI001B8C39ED|nr:phosphatidylglycerophosphatase A [Leptolyngbya sp. 7M]QYO65816.1 phosphatidylglycerophosphatase A [Leptolyngbya sp. 7M]